MAEISGGYDSNVNYATADKVIEVPAFQSAFFILSDDNVEQDDTYVKFSVNMELLHQFTPAARSYVGFNGSKRLLSNEKKFETEDAQLRTYFEFGENIDAFRIGAVAGLSTLDEPVNSHQVGGNMEWRHRFNHSNLFKPPDSKFVSTGKSTFFMSKEFAFKKVFLNVCAIDCNKRFFSPPAIKMDGTG